MPLAGVGIDKTGHDGAGTSRNPPFMGSPAVMALRPAPDLATDASAAMEVSDDSLIARAMEGDEDAVCALLVRYEARLRGCLRGRIGEQYQGAFGEDDVIQVTFIEAFLRIRQFHPNGNGAFLAWLTRIADNNLRDAIRGLDRVRRPPRDRRVETLSPDNSYVALLATLCG